MNVGDMTISMDEYLNFVGSHHQNCGSDPVGFPDDGYGNGIWFEIGGSYYVRNFRERFYFYDSDKEI